MHKWFRGEQPVEIHPTAIHVVRMSDRELAHAVSDQAQLEQARVVWQTLVPLTEHLASRPWIYKIYINPGSRDITWLYDPVGGYVVALNYFWRPRYRVPDVAAFNSIFLGTATPELPKAVDRPACPEPSQALPPGLFDALRPRPPGLVQRARTAVYRWLGLHEEPRRTGGPHYFAQVYLKHPAPEPRYAITAEQADAAERFGMDYCLAYFTDGGRLLSLERRSRRAVQQAYDLEYAPSDGALVRITQRYSDGDTQSWQRIGHRWVVARDQGHQRQQHGPE